MKQKKFNFVDMLVLVVVVIFAIGLFVRFNTPETKSVVTTTPYEITVKVSDVKSFTVDALKKSTTVINGESEEIIGEILSVEDSAFIDDLECADGEIISAPVPERYECLVKIKSECRENDTTFFAQDNSEIKVGSTLYINSKYVGTSGKVVAIEKID